MSVDDETDRERRAAVVDCTARFDSIDSQLRALTRLVEQVLERLPEQPGDASS